MKAIHAVNAVLWQPGEQTRVSQTNKHTNRLLYPWPPTRASGNYVGGLLLQGCTHLSLSEQVATGSVVRSVARGGEYLNKTGPKSAENIVVSRYTDYVHVRKQVLSSNNTKNSTLHSCSYVNCTK